MKFGTSQARNLEEVADIFCAQLLREEREQVGPFTPLIDIESDFYLFAEWFYYMRTFLIPFSTVVKYRRIAILIAGLVRNNIGVHGISGQNRTEIGELLDKHAQYVTTHNITIPSSRGRWTGNTGMLEQIRGYYQTVRAIFQIP